MRKILLILCLCCLPATALAQDASCDDMEIDTVLDCLATDSITNCLTATPDCSQDDINREIAADYLEDYVEERCCVKPKKGKILGCLRSSKGSTKRAARKLLSPELKLDVRDSLDETIAYVKENGECEPEGDDDDDDDS